jgi:DNA replication and repair protein RecF
MDDSLVALAVKHDALRLEIDRILKQRNSLLKQVAGRLTEDAALTLDVWDQKFAQSADQLGHARSTFVARIAPMVLEAYEQLAGGATAIELIYEPAWRRVGLARALADARQEDVRRQTSTVGSHRDDLDLRLNGLPARTHASQGEQRCLALALKLAAHRLVADKAGSPPVLVLDDVLSELDHSRAAALLRNLPRGQVLITTASGLPPEAHPDRTLHVRGGTVAL